MGNAFEFTEKGQISIIIKPMPSENIDIVKLYFAIQDSGAGISLVKQDKLFHAFSQVDSTVTRQYGGTGLGLTISKELCELMEGEIGMQSEEGMGSIFWITAIFEKSTQCISSDQVDIEKEDVNQLKGKKVLFAEDNPVNQIVIKSLLEKLDLSVTIVNNGEEVYQHYHNNHREIDIILMDCEMPVLDGYQAAKKIREFEKNQLTTSIPIIALTAHALTEHKDISLAAGMNEHLSKPISYDQLKHVLSQWLKKSN